MKNLFSKIKDKIAKERYTTSFRLKVLIIVCWIAYIICLIIKLCGGNRFEIATSNETFIALCDYIDNTLWLKATICSIFYVISAYLIYLCLTRQKLFKDWWMLIILLMSSIINVLINNTYVNLGLSLITMIVIPLIKTKGKLWLHIIIGVLLVCLFQQISLRTRSIGWNLDNQSTLVLLIMQVDYYIMLIIYYLYVNGKEVNKNGLD